MDNMLNVQFWGVIGGYCLLLTAVSVYLARNVKSDDDFFKARGKTSWWVSGLSFFMTAFSASVFVANASLAYNYGLLNFLLILAQLPVFIFGYYLFSRKWHRTGVSTAIEFVEKRYSPKTAKFFVWTGVPIRILDNANRLYVTAVLVEALFGVPLEGAIFGVAVVALVYSVGGGFLAVEMTNALQAIVLFIIVGVVAVLGYFAVGGVSGFMANVPVDYWTLQAKDGDFNVSLICAWVFVGLFAWNGMWSLVQRYVCVEKEQDSRKVSLMCGISYYILFPLLALPPMIAAVLLPELRGTAGAEHSYVRIAELLLPSGLLGLLCFGIFGATVTSLNAELNVMSQIIVQDMLKKVLAKTTGKFRLWLGRIITIVIMGACIFIAMQIRGLGGAFKYLMTVLGMTTLPTFIPLLLGLLYRKTSGKGSIAAFLAGLLVSVVLKFGLDQSLAVVIFSNGIVTTLVFFLSVRFLPVPAEYKPGVDELFHRLATPGINDMESEPLPAGTRSRSSLPMMAICLSVLAGVVALASLPIAGQAELSNAGLITAGAFVIVAGLLMGIRIKTAK
jgi:SSS family solute:Na+ symporter